MTYELDEIARQIDLLADDIPAVLRMASEQAAAVRPWRENVVVLGSGDSIHAALACRTAFAGPGHDVTVTNPVAFADAVAHIGDLPSWTVIGVSASGGNPALAQALAAADRGGAATVAVVGKAASSVAEAAAERVTVAITGLRPAPGIRTFQATLIGLLALAGGPPPDVDVLRGAVGKAAATSACDEVAAMLDNVPVLMVVARTEDAGIARHLAAKVTETACLPAMVVEPEDWWHVHRFGRPADQPVLFCTTTPSHGLAAVAARTAARGPVVLVAPPDTVPIDGVTALPLVGAVDGPWRVVADAVCGAVLARALAVRRGQVPFALG